MKMTLRACVYMNCQNYVLDKVPSSTFTLFQFPKNPDRRRKWMELGRAPNNLPQTAYFYCSDHFDKKYLAVNQRRTILVGEALPFEYVEPEEAEKYDTSSVDEDDEYIVYEMKDGQFTSNQEQDFHIESTMQEDEQGNLLKTNDNNSKKTMKFTRKITDDFDETGNVECPPPYATNTVHIQKAKKFKTANHEMSLELSAMDPTEDPTDEQHVMPEYVCSPDVNDLIDSKIATTFIFKDKEYIQMPKETYLEEKLALLEKIEKLENILKSIKQDISAYDLSDI